MVSAPDNSPESAADLLATLTDRDSQLLHNLFAFHRSPFALASHEKLPLREVLLWLAQPRIAAAINLIAKELAEGLKTEALEILREIARESEDPVERRRATTQILRALNLPRPRSTSNGTATGRERASISSGTANGSERASSLRDEPQPTPSEALAYLEAAETFRSEVLSTYGPTLDQTLDAEEDEDLDEDTDDHAAQEPDDKYATELPEPSSLRTLTSTPGTERTTSLHQRAQSPPDSS